MEIGGYLALFTTGYGWYYSGILWQVLAGTGLIFLPIIGMVFDHISEVRSQGSLLSTDPERAIAPLEVKLITMLLVLLIAAVPTSLTSFAPASLTYTQPAGVFNENSRELTIASQAYASDETLSGHPATVAPINIPAWWFMVMKVSGGINRALTSSISNNGEGYRAVKQLADTVAIHDPDLRSDVNIMYTDCYARALSMHQDASESSTVADRADGEIPSQHPDIKTIDTNWIGSKYLYDNYYNEIHSRPVKGFAFDNTVSTQSEDVSVAGQPTCVQLWDRIQQDIFETATAEGLDGFFQSSAAKFLGFFSPATSAEYRREIAQVYLHNTPQEISLTANQIQALRSQGDGFIMNAASFIGDAATSFTLAKTAAVLEFASNAIIDALVTIHAFLLMLVYVFIPLGMLVSRYSVSYLMSMGLIVFSLQMWPAVWTLAAWLDNNLAQALFGDQSAVATLLQDGPREFNKRMIHSLSVLFIYIGGPSVISWVMIAAGAGQVGSVGNLASRSGSNVGAVQSAASGGVAATGNLGSKGLGRVAAAGKGPASGAALK